MEYPTHIHDLDDTVLGRIICPAVDSIPRPFSDEWQEILKSRGDCGMSSFGSESREEYISPLQAPPASASPSVYLVVASVCKRWRCLVESSVSTLLVRSKFVIYLQDLTTVIPRFHNLRHLHICDKSVHFLDDAFLLTLASSCPRLTTFHVGKMSSVVVGATSSVTEAGLNQFFLRCTQLQQFSMVCNRYYSKLPASFFQLARLQAVTLRRASALDVAQFANLSSLTDLRFDSHGVIYQQLASLARLPRLTNLSINGMSMDDQHPAGFAISQLSCLKSLKFNEPCPQFNTMFPSGSASTSLQQLLIIRCRELIRIPDEIGDLLPNLKELSLHGCLYLAHLPDEFTSLCHLESLTISDCTSLQSLPGTFRFLPALKTLVLSYLPLSNLPDSFCQLSSLQQLSLEHCRKLSDLPAGFCNLTALKTLRLSSSQVILPESIGLLINLEDLLVSTHKRLWFPSTFTQLSCLTQLELNNGKILEFPDSMGRLKRLKKLHIHHCPMSGFPDSIVDLTSLEILTVNACNELSSTPMKLKSFTRLKGLQVTGHQLPFQPDMLPPSLEILNWRNNPDDDHLQDLSMLSNLRSLSLSTGAESAFSVARIMPRLTHLELFLTRGVQRLPSSLTSLGQLRSLAIWSAMGIIELPAEIGPDLQQLEALQIHDAESLTRLPTSIAELQQLRTLEIHAAQLTALPKDMGALSRLRELNLSGCSALHRLPDSLTRLAFLNTLDLSRSGISSC